MGVTFDDADDMARIKALETASGSDPAAIAELAAMSKLGADKTRKAAKAALAKVAPTAAAALASAIGGALPSNDAPMTKKLEALEAAGFPAVGEFVVALAARGNAARSYACAHDGEICRRVLTSCIEGGRLDLSGVKHLPDVLAELPVTSLDLHGCGLRDLPACVLAMTGLEKLNLSRNRIKMLGPGVASLTSLQELDFVDGMLASLDNVDRLPALRELAMYRLKIKTVPATFANLTKLETLKIVQCKGITAVPVVIPTMRSLRHLEIDHNAVTEVDPAIWNMSWLHHLDLSGTQLGDVPAAIGNLAEIRELQLRGAGITSLPDEIGQCGKLETLDLVLNGQLKELPEGFYRLTSLRQLRIQYTALPKGAYEAIGKRLPDVKIYT